MKSTIFLLILAFYLAVYGTATIQLIPAAVAGEGRGVRIIEIDEERGIAYAHIAQFLLDGSDSSCAEVVRLAYKRMRKLPDNIDTLAFTNDDAWLPLPRMVNIEALLWRMEHDGAAPGGEQ